MIRAFVHRDGRLEAADPSAPEGALWIDLVSPTEAEAEAVSAALGVPLPRQAEMEEIEPSSRLYHGEAGPVMTALLPADADADAPVMAPASFVLGADRLVTLRLNDPRAFRTYPDHAGQMPAGCAGPEAVMLGLLEEVIDRLADVLERLGRDVAALSATIFAPPEAAPAKARDFRRLLSEIGRKGDMVSNMRDALLSLERLLGFLASALAARGAGRELRGQVKTLARDVSALTEQGGFLALKVNFLLDASLGMISVEQNAIIKIFSVAAVAFLPPTLIASIYGMNFEVMPELTWPWGYPAALAAMVLSALAPLVYFRRRGWL